MDTCVNCESSEMMFFSQDDWGHEEMPCAERIGATCMDCGTSQWHDERCA